MNIQNVHFQKAEYEIALIQLNEGLDVFAADMTMSRLEKANVFSFVVFTDFRDLCSITTHDDYLAVLRPPSRCGQVRTR